MRDEAFRAQLQASLGQAYTLERELGGGGMSRVFVATETALARQVVIKVLPPEMAQGVSPQRFTREIRLAAQLQHPHIVPLLSSGETEGHPWFSMPFVEGESLRAKLARGGELPIADALRILREVASALSHAHARGVVHRDIKPENVLLSEGTAMVADFGVAKALGEAGEASGGPLTSRGIALGTPAYMAPEQCMADPRTDQRADLYAFGVMAYEMLAGRTPFAGRSAQATLAAHVTETPEPVERLRPTSPPALAALVMCCLAKSPADRPQNALELVHALDGLVTPTSGSVPHSGIRAGGGAPETPSTTDPVASVAGIRSRRTLALGVVAVLLVAGGGWFASTRARAPVLSKRRVAIAPFRNETGDTSFNVVGRYAADVLSRELSRDASMDVVSASAVRDAMIGMRPDSDVLPLVARATSATIIVDGSMYSQGDTVRMRASVTDMRTGRPFRTLDPVSAPKRAASEAIEELSARLLGAFEVDRGGWMMTRAPRIDAYREFDRATEFFGRDYVKSREHLHRAIALDSTLFAAYAWLYPAYGNVQMWDSSEAVLANWSRFQDRFSTDELDQFAFWTANIAGDLEKQLAAAKRLAIRDQSGLWTFLAGYNAISTLNGRVALAALLRSDSFFAEVTRAPWGFQTFQLAEAYHMTADHAAELAMLHRRRTNYPNDPTLVARDLRALAALRRRSEAHALADTLLRGTSDPNASRMMGDINTAAMEFEGHGDSAAGVALARQVTRWYASHPASSPSVGRRMQEGIAWLIAGALDSAHHAFVSTVPDTSDVAASGYLAVTLARRGDSLRARSIADSLGALRRKWLFGAHTFWKASIYSEIGDWDAAVWLLGQAYREGARKQHWHFSTQLRSLRGYPPFEALIKPQ